MPTSGEKRVHLLRVILCSFVPATAAPSALAHSSLGLPHGEVQKEVKVLHINTAYELSAVEVITR